MMTLHPRVGALHDRISNLPSQIFLESQAARMHVDDTGKLRQTQYFTFR